MPGVGRPGTVVFVDFNAARKGHLLRALDEDVHGPWPLAGETVLLKNADGDTCEATFVRHERGLVFVDVRWETWVSAPPEGHYHGPHFHPGPCVGGVPGDKDPR